MAPALQNFAQLAPLLEARAERAVLERLQHWTQEQHGALQALLAAAAARRFRARVPWRPAPGQHGADRRRGAHLRCHRVQPAAALDRRDERGGLRRPWICCTAAARDLAYRFVNAYLEQTGDYPGVRLLRYYLVYRALVRAKVAAMRAAQPQTRRTSCARRCRPNAAAHLASRSGIAAGSRPVLIIHHGLSGSGKTTCSQTVLEALGAIRIRSDVERKRLHGFAPGARTGAAVADGIYRSEATRATYERLAQLGGGGAGGRLPGAGGRGVSDALAARRVPCTG